MLQYILFAKEISMEGPKPFEAKPQPAEAVLTPESIAESTERAKDIYAELQAFSNVEMIGGEAMVLNEQAEKLSAALTETLKGIPPKECMENGLPYHPTDIKRQRAVTPFPEFPDYPTPTNHNYPPQAQAA
jgi:hypothetical protein